MKPVYYLVAPNSDVECVVVFDDEPQDCTPWSRWYDCSIKKWAVVEDYMRTTFGALNRNRIIRKITRTEALARIM